MCEMLTDFMQAHLELFGKLHRCVYNPLLTAWKQAHMGLSPRLGMTMLASRKRAGSQHIALPTWRPQARAIPSEAARPWGGSRRAAARDASGSVTC